MLNKTERLRNDTKKEGIAFITVSSFDYVEQLRSYYSKIFLISLISTSEISIISMISFVYPQDSNSIFKN